MQSCSELPFARFPGLAIAACKWFETAPCWRNGSTAVVSFHMKVLTCTPDRRSLSTKSSFCSEIRTGPGNTRFCALLPRTECTVFFWKQNKALVNGCELLSPSLLFLRTNLLKWITPGSRHLLAARSMPTAISAKPYRRVYPCTIGTKLPECL